MAKMIKVESCQMCSVRYDMNGYCPEIAEYISVVKLKNEGVEIHKKCSLPDYPEEGKYG